MDEKGDPFAELRKPPEKYEHEDLHIGRVVRYAVHLRTKFMRYTLRYSFRYVFATLVSRFATMEKDALHWAIITKVSYRT